MKIWLKYLVVYFVAVAALVGCNKTEAEFETPVNGGEEADEINFGPTPDDG